AGQVRGHSAPDASRRVGHGRGRSDAVATEPLSDFNRACRFRHRSFVVRAEGQRGRSVSSPGSGERSMSDARVIHFEVTGKDQKALQSYYSQLFGWKLNTDNPGGYGMTDPATTGLIVGVGATPDGSAGQVTGYITVDDVNAT